jgi:hypothetical protein
MGTSQNAVIIQIYSAFLGLLLYKYIQTIFSYEWWPSKLGSCFRSHMFSNLEFGLFISGCDRIPKTPKSPPKKGLLFPLDGE